MANYLIKQKHEMLNRSWKTRYREIDIVSKLKNVIYFTEVKYRKNANQGGGLDAITNKKLNQMKFAANFYALSNKISNTNLRLAVVSVGGQPLKIDDFIEV